MPLAQLGSEPSTLFVQFMSRLIMEEVDELDAKQQKQVHFKTEEAELTTAEQTPIKNKKKIEMKSETKTKPREERQ